MNAEITKTSHCGLQVLLVPYCRGPLHMVNDGVLRFGIWIHEGHTRLQDGNDVHLEPRLGNVTKMKLVFARQTTYFTHHHSLPGHA